ncbi:MAG: adenosylcobinamide-phosphate synthase CbiB [Halothiobacillaceae bacterium]
MPLSLTVLAAVVLDWWLGEPRRLHPLIGFGRLASGLEARLNPPSAQSDTRQRLVGLLAVLALLTPTTLFAWWLATLPLFGTLWGVLALYFAIGHRSLHDHARPVAVALLRGDMEGARNHAAMLVSRDKEALDPASATCESVLENGSDGVLGALFWFVIAGPAGAVLYRLANTLDAMWGYRTERFLHFGWAAARLDDLLGYLPARLTALTYAILGHTRQALACWRAQAPTWKSPNAGPVMAAGAGALGIHLGGPARYHGQWQVRPPLGAGRPAEAQDIGRALTLVSRGTVLWLVLILLGAILYEGVRHA